ncbi:MAG: subclass B1 metallo-beta-lactamase [Saprospiraceae bacterium]
MKHISLMIIVLLTGFTQVVAQSNKLDIKVESLTKDVYVHVSYQRIGGNPYPSNGLIVKTSEGVLLVDTGWGEDATEQLYKWVRKNLKAKVKLCIVTHSHGDRASGTGFLQKKGVKVISTPLTAEKSAIQGYAMPDGILPNDTTFTFGDVMVQTFFPGEGHTNDNIVVYLPEPKVLFGGCFVKSSVSMGLGNIADANLKEWGNSMRNVIKKFPDVKFIIPGHEDWESLESLKHTIQLLEKANTKVIGG